MKRKEEDMTAPLQDKARVEGPRARNDLDPMKHNQERAIIDCLNKERDDEMELIRAEQEFRRVDNERRRKEELDYWNMQRANFNRDMFMKVGS